jgi:hypothetical protein
MGVPTSEVGYPSATTGRGDHEARKGHVVALTQKILRKEKKTLFLFLHFSFYFNNVFYKKCTQHLLREHEIPEHYR